MSSVSRSDETGSVFHPFSWVSHSQPRSPHRWNKTGPALIYNL